MSNNIDIYDEVSLPALPLRGIVAFPGVQTSIEIVRGISLKAFTAAATVHDAKIILVAQKDLMIEEPTEKDLYKVGTLAKIVHVVKNPQGNLSVIFEGIARVKIDSFDFEPGFIIASGTAKRESSVIKDDNVCDAIIMDDAHVSALPQITANHIDAALIHEAAIGKIAGEQLIKLMTLGLTESEAEEKIVNGFLK